MKKCVLLLTVILLPLFAQGALAQTLLTSGNMSYVGAFRITPSTTGSTNGFSYGGYYPAFNPNSTCANKSIFLVDRLDNLTAELCIPTIVGGSTLANLNTATFSPQNSGGFFDSTQGHLPDVGSGGTACTSNPPTLCGQMVNNGLLLGNACIQYDGANCQNLSAFTHSPTLSTSSFAGMYGLNVTGLGANTSSRSLGGYLAAIPSNLQSQLGGTVLSGLTTSSINSTTSYGPSAGSWNPSGLSSTPLNVNYLVGYPYGHWTVTAGTSGSSRYWSDADYVSGAALPAGSSTLLFFGVHATGTSTGGAYCYGYGTSTKSEQCEDGAANWSCPSGYGCGKCNDSGGTCNGNTLVAGDSCCYDPANSSKGQHAYPYVSTVWAYDVGQSNGANSSGNSPSNSMCLGSGMPFASCTGAGTGTVTSSTYNNLTAAKLGYTNYYNLAPYATWALNDPFNNGGTYNLQGATYDSSTGNLYVAAAGADPGTGYFVGSVIEVYNISGGTAPATQYTITASSDSNSTISPSGSVVVNSGATQQFSVTPSSGYTASVGGTCGGTLSGTTYTTSAITANCTVTVTSTAAGAPPAPGAPFLQN